MVALLAVVAAVAGGNLAVTIAPAKPIVGRPLAIRTTGQVGSSGGRLYVYRNLERGCAATARGESRRGRRLASRSLQESFDFEIRYRPRRAGRQWICAYLYSISCDAAGQDCGPATGLPPDAGFAAIRVRVRAPR